MMDRDAMGEVMRIAHTRMEGIREKAQKEYAREDGNAFSNFEWIAEFLSRGRCCEKCGEPTPIDRETVLMIYFLKHVDAVMAHVNGHEEQREEVRGRIDDSRVYLTLLEGMIYEGGQRDA